VLEYYEALDKRANSQNFPLILVLLEGQTAPGLPFLRTLHWIISRDPASGDVVGRLFDEASGSGTNPGELWRYTHPYRGLAAMEEKDSDYFFGRSGETVEVLKALAAPAPGRIPVLIGNSGVGKSSLLHGRRNSRTAAIGASSSCGPAPNPSKRWSRAIARCRRA
jgi:hypothetical protein